MGRKKKETAIAPVVPPVASTTNQSVANITSKSITNTDDSLNMNKIKSFLLSEYPQVRKQVCDVLADGLTARRAVVCDKDVVEVEDHPTRLKYALAIGEILGDINKTAAGGELHLHFTNILQQIRAFEKGDKRAIDDARNIIEEGQ